MSIILPKSWEKNADTWVRPKGSYLIGLEWGLGILSFKCSPSDSKIYSQIENCMDFYLHYLHSLS